MDREGRIYALPEGEENNKFDGEDLLEGRVFGEVAFELPIVLN